MRLKRFVEKPDVDMARSYLEAGITSGTAGSSSEGFQNSTRDGAVFTAGCTRDLKTIEESVGSEKDKRGPRKPSIRNWKSISVDYGVLERSQDVLAIPASFDWSDIGSWSALYEVLEPDPRGIS